MAKISKHAAHYANARTATHLAQSCDPVCCAGEPACGRSHAGRSLYGTSPAAGRGVRRAGVRHIMIQRQTKFRHAPTGPRAARCQDTLHSAWGMVELVGRAGLRASTARRPGSSGGAAPMHRGKLYPIIWLNDISLRTACVRTPIDPVYTKKGVFAEAGIRRTRSPTRV